MHSPTLAGLCGTLSRVARLHRPSKELQDRVEALRAFLAALERLRGTCEIAQNDIFSWLHPLPQSDNAFQEAKTEVTLAAGRAVEARGDAAVFETQFGMTTDPLMNWQLAFKAGSGSVDEFESARVAGLTTLGMLEEQLRDAAAIEKTLGWKVGRFITFPSRSRDAVTGGAGAKRATFAAALAVNIIAALVAAALLAGLGALAASVFG